MNDQPFVLSVNFDEPHDPCLAPPDYWENASTEELPERPNYLASTEDKPRLQKLHQRQRSGLPECWEEYVADKFRHLGCISFVDHQVGRIMDCIDRLHGEDTMIIFTSDHGDQLGSHGLKSKGPYMYEESCNIPFIIRDPRNGGGRVSDALVSHLDIMPTMLEAAGLKVPPAMNGASLNPLLSDPNNSVHEAIMLGFHRFSINHDNRGGFYPIRCATDGRYRLVLNLLDSDEFYDLTEDPYEMTNLINQSSCAKQRDRLHDWLLEEMNRIRDPFRTPLWGERSWRRARTLYYKTPGDRPRIAPEGFPFEPEGLLGENQKKRKEEDLQ